MENLLATVRGHHGERVKRFEKGEHLYNWGAPGSTVLLIEKGLVKSCRYSSTGKPCVLRIDGPSDLLGLTFALNKARSETAIATTEVEVISFSAVWLQEAIGEHGLEDDLWHYLSARIESQSSSLEYFVTLDSRQRLGAMLLKLIGQLGVQKGGVVVLDHAFTHEELAQIVGTTRSRIGFFLQEFEAAGLIERTRCLMTVHTDRMDDFLTSGDLVV